MRRSVWFAGTLGTLVLSGAGLGAAEPGAYVERQGDAVRLGNASLEITFNAGGVLTEVRNKLSNRLVPVREDDFAIEVTGSGEVGRQQFAFQGLREGAFEGGRSLSLDYALEGLGLKLAVVCELRDRDFLLRRRLELTCAKPLELGRVEVWGLGLGGTCTHQGFGNPVFLEDLFLGLEYPDVALETVVSIIQNLEKLGTVEIVKSPSNTGRREP